MNKDNSYINVQENTYTFNTSALNSASSSSPETAHDTLQTAECAVLPVAVPEENMMMIDGSKIVASRLESLYSMDSIDSFMKSTTTNNKSASNSKCNSNDEDFFSLKKQRQQLRGDSTPSPTKDACSSATPTKQSPLRQGRATGPLRHQHSQKLKKHSIKFSANNFVTQCYDSFDSHYEILDRLGEGAYGDVFVCRHRESNAERAVKILKVKSEKEVESVLSEFNILQSIDHPNLLKIYNLYIQQDEVEPEAESESFYVEDKLKTSTFHIVSDLYQGGELYDEIEQGGNFHEEDAAMIMNQVLSCINYCHNHGIVHRDIKPENILLADDQMRLDDIKIIDFGLAAVFEDYNKDRFHKRTGSCYYVAPEVLEGDYGPRCDVWSCGVVAYILLTGEAPFDGEDDMEIIESIFAGELDFESNPVWEQISEDAKDFVEWLLTFDEMDRPTAEEALRHPWLENTRRNSSLDVQNKHATAASEYLSNIEQFCSETKLKQAVCSFIASQLILKQEKDVIDELFRAMDTECDGKLSKEELKAGYEKFAGKELTDAQVEDLFQRVNYSSSGLIKYSEFVVAAITLDETRLQATFDAFSKSGSGFLTADDLKEALALGDDDHVEDYVLNKVMNEIDTQQDNAISFEEFKAAMMKSRSDGGTPSNKRGTGAGLQRRRSFGRASIRRSTRVLMEAVATEKTKIATRRNSSDLKKSQSSEVDSIMSSLQSTIDARKNIKTVKSYDPVPHAVSVSYAKRSIRNIPVRRNAPA